MLDFTPNAVHAGIYMALARGYDRAAGVRLKIVTPTASTDSIRLLETGRANFAILDIHDLAIARERGADVVGIMAIVERPLASVIAAPQITDPRQLAGKTVGVTGDPSDLAVLRSVVAGSGGDPQAVKTITIGFDAVPALLSGRVAAATAFWNDEGITLAHRASRLSRIPGRALRGPRLPGAGAVRDARRPAGRSEPGARRGRARSSTATAPRWPIRKPQSGTSSTRSRASTRRYSPAELRALLPAFRAPDGLVGDLDLTTLAAWARWEARFGIVARPPDVSATFDRSFVAGYCTRRRLNSSRTDSGRPHICITSTRPVRTSRTASSPSMPASSSNFRAAWTAGLDAAWPKR